MSGVRKFMAVCFKTKHSKGFNEKDLQLKYLKDEREQPRIQIYSGWDSLFFVFFFFYLMAFLTN